MLGAAWWYLFAECVLLQLYYVYNNSPQSTNSHPTVKFYCLDYSSLIRLTVDKSVYQHKSVMKMSWQIMRMYLDILPKPNSIQPTWSFPAINEASCKFTLHLLSIKTPQGSECWKTPAHTYSTHTNNRCALLNPVHRTHEVWPRILPGPNQQSPPSQALRNPPILILILTFSQRTSTPEVWSWFFNIL